MAIYYLGQIMMTGFPFAQKGFALANGQLLGIAQNQALFSLLGTTYGGNGVQNFQLPDLRGRVPVGYGNSATISNGYPLGMVTGSENVTITQQSMPTHQHAYGATTTKGDSGVPETPMLYAGSTSGVTTEAIYAAPGSGANVPLMPTNIGNTGGSAPHSNMQPFQVINFNIALTGIFPSRN